MRVRITRTPEQHELDGVVVDDLRAGTVRDVSASIGSWLIAEGCAVLEMRQAEPEGEDRQFWGITALPSIAAERRRSPRR